MVSPFLLRDILDVAIPENRDELLLALVAGMIGISIVTGVLGVGQTWLTNVVGQRVMHDLRTQVYRHLQRLSLAFFTRTRTGEIQSRIANDIGGVQYVVTSTAASIVSNVTTVVASVVAMFLLDWRLALFSLALLPFFVLLARRVGNQRRKITTVKQGAMADISSLVQESLSVSGILLGKTMGRGAELADRFDSESENLADLEVRSRMAGRWMMAAIQTSFAVMPALVYLFAGLAPGAASIGTIVAFTTLQTRLFFPVQSLLQRRRRHPDLDRAVRPRLRVPRPRGRHRARDPRRWTTSAARCASTASGSATATSGRCATSTSTVPAGTRTALVGETGAGKTSLGYLAARLYDPERGAVRIDGTDLRELTFDALAGAVGVVSQETYLFHASVRENLRFAQPDATDEEIEDAARAAQIHDTIAALPDGYDTVVGERGFRFSGGEKQRIAIARTVLRNPPVLVLDEATSALDVQTERAVGEALEKLAEGRTTIVIAHRLSTVRDADQIVVLDDGEVAERGTHEELLALGGRYAALVARDEGSTGRRPRTSAECSWCDRASRSYGGRRAPSVAAMLVALLALFVALGGPAQAKHLINGKDIRKGTVRSAQIKDKSLTTRDLSSVDRADAADARRTARSATRQAGAAAPSPPTGSAPGAVGGAGDRRRDGGGRRHRRRRGDVRQARRRRGHRREDRRRLADDGGHRALLGRVPDRRRRPRDDRAASSAGAASRAGSRPSWPAPTSPRTRCSSSPRSTFNGAPAELQLPDVGAERERSGARQPLRADAVQP